MLLSRYLKQKIYIIRVHFVLSSFHKCKVLLLLLIIWFGNSIMFDLIVIDMLYYGIELTKIWVLFPFTHTQVLGETIANEIVFLI